jgi:cbb3-type cytochrome c oxidase subunit III
MLWVKRVIHVGFAVLLLLSSGASSSAAQSFTIPDSLPPGVTPQMVERGATVFRDEGLCAKCHGPQAGGYLGPNLTSPDWWHAEGSYLALIRQILVGVPADQSISGAVMAPRGGTNISDEDVQAAAAYVWTLSHPHAADSLPNQVTPEIVARGSDVFHGQGQCFTCHGQDATGDLGPDLTDEQWLHTKGSYLTILQQVLVGVPASRSRSGVEMPPRGGSGISDEDVHSVAAYVWVLSQR